MNIANRTLFISDNLPILRGIDSETIDLIYLDPPFNTKKQYKAPIGSPAEGASFKDIWTDADIKHEWHGEIAETHAELYQVIQASEAVYDKSMRIYLTAMAVRLFEMHRILKPTGSIYLHCDPTASHYLKLVMDSLFGKNGFRNEIAWNKYIGRKNNARKKFGTQQDIILYYAKKSAVFNPQYEPLSESAVKEYRHKNKDGRRYRYARRGKGYESIGGKRKIYLDENLGIAIGTLWVSKDLQLGQSSGERTGYPTQKPLALLERIIKASSNEGDIVLDPFCGCATACVAAERLNRQWVGIDISPSAETITKIRLEEASEQGQLFSPIQMSDVTVTRNAPIRTDTSDTARQISLPSYRTHKNELYGRQEGHCNGCGLHFRIRNLTIDHIKPQTKDGTDHIENLQLLCGSCNSIKGDRPQEYLYQRLEEQERELKEKLRVYET